MAFFHGISLRFRRVNVRISLSGAIFPRPFRHLGTWSGKNSGDSFEALHCFFLKRKSILFPFITLFFCSFKATKYFTCSWWSPRSFTTMGFLRWRATGSHSAHAPIYPQRSWPQLWRRICRKRGSTSSFFITALYTQPEDFHLQQKVSMAPQVWKMLRHRHAVVHGACGRVYLSTLVWKWFKRVVIEFVTRRTVEICGPGSKSQLRIGNYLLYYWILPRARDWDFVKECCVSWRNLVQSGRFFWIYYRCWRNFTTQCGSTHVRTVRCIEGSKEAWPLWVRWDEYRRHGLPTKENKTKFLCCKK